MTVKKRKGAVSNAKKGVNMESKTYESDKKAKKLKRCRYSEDGEGVKNDGENLARRPKREGGNQKARGRADGDQKGGNARKRHIICMATCEDDSCPKTARFGVNGAVRYW